MKTQILQLEPHDDVISARDKMGWGQTARVLLVWPNRGRILTRRIDLELLLRHSHSLGGQLALVTRDPDVRYHAKQIGIHVFKTVRQAQQTRWQRPHRRRLRPLRHITPSEVLSSPPPGRSAALIPLSNLGRLGLFSLGVLALLSIVAVLLPGAEIRLDPKIRIQEITIPVQANLAVERVNLSGLIPIQPVTVVVEGRDSLEPTGNTQVPENRARGEVRFTNLTDREISIPAGTVVSTPGSTLRFTTDRSAKVPAGAGESSDLPVTALAPGSLANLPADRIKAIEGPLGLSLTVTNLRPLRGGTERTTPAPTPLDRTRLANRLLATLQDSARAEVQALMETNDLLLTPSLTRSQTLEEVYDPPQSGPASLLSLTLRLEFQALIISGEDLQQLANTALDANLPEGYVPQSSSLNIEHLSTPTIEAGSRVGWEMKASRALQAQLAEPHAASMTLGLPPAQASQRLLASFPLNNPPTIQLTPPWWPRLPFLPFRIHVSTRTHD
ncbi:MAG TPA: baseplate J/gp47 family protein [Anaerolineales bacterium]